jgi:hypothetical protein
MDLGDYRTLLRLYSDMLDNLKRQCSIESRCASEMAYGPEVRERSEQARRALYGHIKNFARDLDTLEGRNPEFVAIEGKFRAKLEARQRQIERWAEERGVSVGSANAEDRSTVHLAEQVRGTTAPKAPMPQPASGTVPPDRQNLVVGDTATSSSGDTYTLHACEVHHEEGTDLLALDIEGCAAPNQEGPRRRFNRVYFKLHMTDNTRLESAFRPQSRYDRLEHGDLLPGDCVRGWIFFHIPEGKKPKFVVFSEHYGSRYPEDWIIKWDIQRHW